MNLQFNGSFIDTIGKEIGKESTFYWLLISIISAITWAVYLTYYNSRVLGLILTAILNRFVKFGHVRFGSFSWSVLSGKIMFRDVHLITEDYSIRIQLGYAIFRWWRPLVLKEITEDFSHSETRLTVYIDSFELHVYNRSSIYSSLEKVFGLEQQIFPPKEDESRTETRSFQGTSRPGGRNTGKKWQWRDLIPVIKFDISSGRLVFGNYLLPTSLSVNARDARITYTTKPSSTPFDHFMHTVKCKADNLRVMLVPSPKYQGTVDEPPRFMGDGFVLLQSSDIDIYYYHDEPGLVPYEPELVELANGDVVARRTWPCWGMDVKCGKGTDISYGPWADRQREYLWKFFYPPDHQPMQVTELPDPGQMRTYKSFDFKMSMQNDATIDILFTKNKETQAIHMSSTQGSYLEFTIPFITEESGYVTKVMGQLMNVDATTSLQFRSFLEFETLEFDIEARYPRHWNVHQDWKCNFTACKSSGYLVFHHKVFFQDLIEDWSSKSRPDILHFVPYTWKFNLLMKEFELILLSNEWNWIDCSGRMPEDAQIAFLGDLFEMSFSLPFIDYLPPTVPLKFFIRGECMDCRLELPETNTNRHVIKAISQNMKIMGRDGHVLTEPFAGCACKNWRKLSLERAELNSDSDKGKIRQKSADWIDCWTTPIVALNVGYTYHPMSPSGEGQQKQLDEVISTPDAEERLLIPLRLVPLRPLRPRKNVSTSQVEEFEPTIMEPDVITVELEVGPSVLCVYGSLLRNFYHLKENYFGEDQKFADIAEMIATLDKHSAFEHIVVNEAKDKPFDARHYRPLEVKVQFTLHDIQGHLVKNCNPEDPPCPYAYVERVGFEMDKRYLETKLQVLVSPAFLIARDNFKQRPNAHGHLREGHLALSGLQVRGHAMFSHEGLPLDSDTLEYAWMVEASIGDVTGRLTAPQLQNIIEFLQTLVFLVEDSENELQRAVPYKICEHGVPQPECKAEPKYPFPCPSPDDIKYRLTRASVDIVDLYLVEAGSALNVQIYPVRLATCNLHGRNNKAGITAKVININLKQFVLTIPVNQQYKNQSDNWLEAGGVYFGPVTVDAATALPCPEFHSIQDRFLKKHDRKTRRLTFMWPVEPSPTNVQRVSRCGCLGGCIFFGNNRNGERFFQPSREDYVESYSSAVFHLSKDDTYLGYGQSLLHKDCFMFENQFSSFPATPNKGQILKPDEVSISSKQTGDTVQSNATLVDQLPTQEEHFPSDLSINSDDSKLKTLTPDQTLTMEAYNELAPPSEFGKEDLEANSSLKSGRTGSIPSEYLPDSPMPDPFDSDRAGSTPSDLGKKLPFETSGSATSLPDAATCKLYTHARKHSYDPPKSSKTSINCGSSRVGSSSSKGSLLSPTLSRHSSLASPLLRRLSSPFVIQRESSTTSMGSDRFFSAAEDASESLSNIAEINTHATLSRETSNSSNQSNVSASGRRPTQLAGKTIPEMSSSSSEQSESESITSFVSAVSSQHASRQGINKATSCSTSSSLGEDEIGLLAEEEEIVDEEPTAMNSVDLHGQMNQQITKSPLMISCYMSHMTQLQCSHWASPPPLPQHYHHVTGQSDSVSSTDIHDTRASPPDHRSPSHRNAAWIPEFVYIREGFTPKLLVSKKEICSPPSLSSPSPPDINPNNTRVFFPDSTDNLSPHAFGSPGFEEGVDDTAMSHEDHVSETTAIVKLEGSVNVMISPLMLEALQRYVEAVTPVLRTLHPSAIVDSLHFTCASAVKSQNKLKKKLSQQAADKKEDEATDNVDGWNTDSKTSRLQVMLSLSRINICVMQASLVEEIIPASAIERVRELTCVSLLSACLDNISCQLLMSNRSKKSLEVAADNSPDSAAKKGMPSQGADLGKKKESSTGDADVEQTVETQQEDLMGKLHIARIHFQLRRMKKNSNFSDNVFLTAIPEYRSKVLFTFQRQNLFGEPECQSAPSDGQDEVSSDAEDVAGFIMFECGLQDITLKAARRLGYDGKQSLVDGDNIQKFDKLLHSIRETHNRTNVQDVGQSTNETDRDGHRTDKERGAEEDKESDMASAVGSTSTLSGNSADDEMSWQSRVSIPSDATVEEEEQSVAMETLQGNASNCVLEFKTVWFNFAAPPPSPKKKKLEYTRFDWNLLSTATPAFNAWLNPGHRATVAAKTLVRKLEQRISRVMACIMTEALEHQSVHMLAKSKHTKITSLAKTLQEDPSCQLLTVLRRYIKKVGVEVVENNLAVDTIPQLLTIQKGLLALTRQWKNILFTPILADINFKANKKVLPFQVTFADAEAESMENLHSQGLDEPETMMDNYDVVDEKTSLLKAEGGSIQRSESVNSASMSVPRQLSRPASVANVGSGGGGRSPEEKGLRKGSSLECFGRTDKAAAGIKAKLRGFATPYSSFDSPAKHTGPSQTSQSQGQVAAGSSSALLPPGRQTDPTTSVASGSASASSVEPGLMGASVPSTPMRPSLSRHLSQLERRDSEDLFRWMQRQKEYTQLCNHPGLHCYPSMGHDSLATAGLSRYSQDDIINIQRLATITHSAFQMVDAQVLFKPLLRAIGLNIGAVKTTALMKKFGGNVSVKGLLETLRIDIVDSETSSTKKSRPKGKGRGKRLPRFHINTCFETPAFLCDTFAVKLGMQDIVDFEKGKEEEQKDMCDIKKKSLQAIKFAMDQIESNPTTTKVDFSVICHAVTQHVNMSLLRLVHQFVTMIENIQETRTELKGLTAIDAFRGHRKHDSNGSSSPSATDTMDPLDLPRTPDAASVDTTSPVHDSAPSSQPRTPVLTSSAQPHPPLLVPAIERTMLSTPMVEIPLDKYQSRPEVLPLSFISKCSDDFPVRKSSLEISRNRSSPTEPSDDTISTNLQSPRSCLPLNSTAAIDLVAETSSPALAEKTIVDEIKENTPKCWRTLYHLLDLYSTLPETKTVAKPAPSRLSVIDEESEKISQTHSVPKFDAKSDKDDESVERQPHSKESKPRSGSRPYTGSTFTQSILIGERIPLVVFGMAKVKRIRILATLSGLKLEADLQNTHASATHREKVKGVLKRRTRESSATAYAGHTMIVLFEGVPPAMQTVVTLNIAKSQGLYSSLAKKQNEYNSGFLTIGKIDIDIPQHPVVLHDMVARSSKRLSTTLQEFIRPLPKPRPQQTMDTTDSAGVGQQVPRSADISEPSDLGSMPSTLPRPKEKEKEEPPAKPFIIHFKAILQGLTVGASLLPSLKAQYRMGEVAGSGITGKKARFTVDLPTHSLSFTSKVVPQPPIKQPPSPYPLTSTPYAPPIPPRRRGHFKHSIDQSAVNTPSSLPSSASVDLPPVHIHADYRQHSAASLSDIGELTEGLTLRQGNYLNAHAEVGKFEHSLTTDLLNHLVFVQKVFMKEINEVVQKVSGADQPVPLWSDDGISGAPHIKPLLYSLHFRLKGIQITATTPTSSAVRLETDIIELELSNRVQKAKTNEEPNVASKNRGPLKVFVKMQLDVKLALGTLLKNPMFEEADTEFQHLASFDTRISMRNALQDEMIPATSKDQEALLISLRRPIVFVQPSAFDKAVLVWLNYKNAYEYWNEQRMALNKEVQTATQQVFDKLPLGGITQQTGQTTSTLGTLFLQLTVDDMGICLPMNAFKQGITSSKNIDEPGAALVVTLESTLITACSCGSLVSKGNFNGFCLRFADDFEVSWDDWKPNTSEPVMNGIVVPKGTYEVCSRTLSGHADQPFSNPKWILNVDWKMRGIDIQLDTNIGKQLSVLGVTLTSLAGDQDDSGDDSTAAESQVTTSKAEPPSRKSSLLLGGLPEFVYDPSLDPKTRARLIEKEMNDQAQVVEDLKQLGASQSTIGIEERKFLELEAEVFHVFRQDIRKKLKKQSVKATALKDKLGLGYKPVHVRSKSIGVASIVAAAKRRELGALPDGRMLSHYGEDLDKESALPFPAENGHTRTMSLDVMQLSPKVRFEGRDAMSVTLDDPTVFDLDARTPSSTTSPMSNQYTNLLLQDITSSSSESEDVLDPDIPYIRRPPSRLSTGRAKSPPERSQKVSTPSTGSGSSQKAQLEPSVDFEFDIRVDIDSGQCVLHPKEPKAEMEAEVKKSSARLSPRIEKKKGSKQLLSTSATSSRLQPPSVTNTTVFTLPGVSLKVHYNSKTGPLDGSESPVSSKTEMGGQPTGVSAEPGTDSGMLNVGVSNKKSAGKKANLYAWLQLQKLSEEMLISPCLLDFLEQALDPIPMIPLGPTKTQNKTYSRGGSDSVARDLEASTASLVSSGNYAAAYASFPVDVVVYLRVQPSIIRFTCLPVSRVECLLRVPSLDVVFSTKRADVEANLLPDSAAQARSGKVPSLKRMASGGVRARTASGHQSEVDTGGGLSVTGCLADFSLYIFHPYGGTQKKTSFTSLENAFRRGLVTDAGMSPLEATGRKDSLNLNVEFVKVNISRSRKGVLQGEVPFNTGQSSGKLSSLDTQTKAANVVRFSAVCDIGSASFKYDMRRLSEILALPKAWYRRSLARRVFLGEETAVLDSDSEGDDLQGLTTPPTPDSPLFSPLAKSSTLPYSPEKKIKHRRVSSDDKTAILTQEFKRELQGLKGYPSPLGSGSRPQSPLEDRPRLTPTALSPSSDVTPTRLNSTSYRKHRYVSNLDKTQNTFTTPVTAGARAIKDWETLVLFAVNLSRLDVMVNMSNVMGNTVWCTTDLKSRGRLSIDSSGFKNMKITAGLGGSKLEARGGIVGGNIELQQLDTHVLVSEDPGKEPDHEAKMSLNIAEARLDYMGSSVLMGRISDLNMKLGDEWRVVSTNQTANDSQPSVTKRPALIFVHCDLTWDKYHLMISRSTTPDLIKMVTKLEEFFTQQFNSSKRVFSAFGPIAGSNRQKGKRRNGEEASWISEIRHHRHWQMVLEYVSGCKFPMLTFSLPEQYTILGGTISLHGSNLSLACFHGINFRSKSWALFTMEEPAIHFATESQDVNKEDSRFTHIVQNLSFQLSHNFSAVRSKRPMAVVCKLSRGHYMPPPFTSVTDWFHYAFATSEVKNLDSFPQMAREGSESPTERRVRRGPESNHDTEVIFILPSLQMNLKTEHLQAEHEPDEEDPKPVVECSFVTEFEDHIFVAMDAEAILFLHDLVTNYVREKDRGVARLLRSPEAEKKPMPSDPTTVLKLDYREFVCNTWHLEPTVRLISWAGKRIDPVGVDYILQRLGFQHARLTIPKWMQRGFMDPLDKILSILVYRLIHVLQQNADDDDSDSIL